MANEDVCPANAYGHSWLTREREGTTLVQDCRFCKQTRTRKDYKAQRPGPQQGAHKA